MRYFSLILFIFATILFCKNNASDTITVKYVGELRFRKTYANIQFITDENERDKYLQQQEKSNPLVNGNEVHPNFTIINRFEKLGLICRNTSHEYELLLPKFNFLTEPTYSFRDTSGVKYKLEFYPDSSGSTTFFKLFSPADSIVVDTESTTLQDLNYIFLDIIPGGNKELIFLDDYYIMNGDNFDLKVYEINRQKQTKKPHRN